MINDFLQKYKIKDEVIAVGVSGGADSLALALMLNDALSSLGGRIVAVTIDHRLRKESAAEAAYVAEVMMKNGIEHHILVWEGKKPTASVEEAARIARYQLLSEWCVSHKINSLAIAHHLFDQAETFLMRLQRGSGLDGLCGMSPVSSLNNIRLLRPLLRVHPQILKDYLAMREIAWIEDPSNQSEEYLRVRARHFLPLMEEKLGISAERIVSTMDVLAQSRGYLQEQTDYFIKHCIKNWNSCGFSVAKKTLLDLADEMLFRVLASLLKEAGKRYYSPESDEICRLIASLKEDDFRGCTLGGCEVFENGGKIWIVPELKNKEVMPKKLWEAYIELHPEYKKTKIPYKLRLSLLKKVPI